MCRQLDELQKQLKASTEKMLSSNMSEEPPSAGTASIFLNQQVLESGVQLQ